MKLFVKNDNYSESIHPVTTKDILTVASFLYLISNIGWLLAHGVFWDDWAIYENPVGIEQMMSGNGGTWTITIHIFFLNLSHQIHIDVVLLYKVIILLLGWIDLFFYFCILRQLNLNNMFVLFSSIMFASWPLGYSHMLMCCVFYQMGLLFQLVAVSLFIRVVNKENLLLSLLIFVFQFLASMFLNSTIVFWFGFLIVMATFNTFNYYSFSYKYAVIWSKKILYYSLYFIPCLLFWGMRNIFWMPTGVYSSENYNTITIRNIINAPVNSISALLNTLSFIFNQFASVSSSYLYFFIFFILVIGLLWFFKNKDLSADSYKFSCILSLFFLFLCSIAAYVLVGKVPIFDHVNDRFAILLALVIPPLLVSLSLFFSNNTAYKLVFIFVSVFCTYSISQSFEGIRLSHRNDAIMEFFKKNELPSGNVIIAEQCPKLRSNYYTWAGLHYMATGLQNRCFECTDIGVLYDNVEYLTEEYCQKNAKSGAPSLIIYFVNEDKSKSFLSTFKRLIVYFIDKEKYKQMVLNDFDIRWQKIIHN